MLKDVFIYTLKCLLYFWCPFGRASRKEFSCFYTAVIVVAGMIWALVECLPVRQQGLVDELIARFEIPLICLCVVVAFALTTALIRRGHDLGYGGLTTYIKSAPGLFHRDFCHRLFKEDGSAEPNKYGPAPKENL